MGGNEITITPYFRTERWES